MINKRMAQRRKLSIQNCFYHLDFFELVKYARLGNIEIWSTILKWLGEVIWYIQKKKKKIGLGREAWSVSYMVGHSQVYHSIVNAALSLISSMPFRAKRGTLSPYDTSTSEPLHRYC